MVKTAIFGHFGEKMFFNLIFFMFQDLTFTFQAKLCPLIGLKLKVQGFRTPKKHLIRIQLAKMAKYTYILTIFGPFQLLKSTMSRSYSQMTPSEPLTRPLEVNTRVRIHQVAINCEPVLSKLENKAESLTWINSGSPLKCLKLLFEKSLKSKYYKVL